LSNSKFRLSMGLCLIVLFFLPSVFPVYAQEKNIQSDRSLLTRHLEEARSADPGFLAARAAKDAADRALDGSRALLGPKVALSVNITRTERTEEATNFLGQRSEIDRRFGSRLNQLQARQPIFRKRELVGIEQAESQAEASRRSLASADQDLAMRLLLAWTDVLVARSNKITFQGAAQAAQESFAETDRRYKAGDTTIQEVDRDRARLSQAQALIEDAIAQEAIADQVLKTIAGPAATVPAFYSLLAFTPIRTPAYSRDELLRTIETKNQDIAAARYQEYAALLEREKARSDRYPTLDAIASASQGRNDTLPTIKNEQRIGLQLSVPIYTHGAIRAAVDQADANFRRAQAQTQATINKINSDTLAAYGNLAVIQSRISATDQLYQATLLSLRAQQAGFRAGISSRAEIAKTIAELFSVARQRIGIRRDQIAAWAKVQAAIGGFDTELLESLHNILSRPISLGEELNGIRIDRR